MLPSGLKPACGGVEEGVDSAQGLTGRNVLLLPPTSTVIPAKAGIPFTESEMGPGFAGVTDQRSVGEIQVHPYRAQRFWPIVGKWFDAPPLFMTETPPACTRRGARAMKLLPTSRED